jgi:hypothetical protein
MVFALPGMRRSAINFTGMAMRIHALTLAALLFVPSAFAAPTTGVQILQACGSAVKQQDGAQISMQESIESIWCIGYLGGLLDGFGMSPPKINGRQVLCLPEQGITNDQLVRLVTKWLREHPENLHESGRMEALIALSKAFPCK